MSSTVLFPSQSYCLADALVFQVDYGRLADACGMSNPRSASNAWGRIKKKITARARIFTNGYGSEASAATPSKKRKVKTDANYTGEAPTKKQKANKGNAKAINDMYAEIEDGDNESPVKAEPEVDDEELTWKT